MLLTATEAAAYLKISKRKLYTLPVARVKLGAVARWRQCDLDEMVERCLQYPVEVSKHERRIPRRKALLDMEGLSLWEKAQRLRLRNEGSSQSSRKSVP